MKIEQRKWAAEEGWLPQETDNTFNANLVLVLGSREGEGDSFDPEDS